MVAEHDADGLTRFPGAGPGASGQRDVRPGLWLSAAAWSSGGWLAPRGARSASWSDQRPLTSVTGTRPRAERSAEVMTGVSALALAAPIWPLTWIGVPWVCASRPVQRFGERPRC